MKRFIWAWVLCALIVPALAGEKINWLALDNKRISDVRDVHLAADGRVIILYQDTGVTVPAEKLSDSFLESWGITKNSIQETQKKYRDQQEKKSQDDLERAIARGSFRAVDGVIYDLRKPQPGWVQFSNVRVFQVISEGAMVDASPSPYSAEPIFVRNVPPRTGDSDVISFYAKQVENLKYLNGLGQRRTIRTYDIGVACKKSDIPEDLLTGKVASIKKPGYQPPQKNALKDIPESNDLKSCGTGFFITDDGYLITNAHVVKDAKKIRIKTKSEILYATVIKMDQGVDLALLKATGKFSSLHIADTTEAQLGETAFTIGFPNPEIQGLEPKYTDGKISSLKGLHDDSAEYQISVPVQPGNSGGALVNAHGEVVGVIVARLNDLTMIRAIGSIPQNVNYAIKARVLRDFISRAAEVKLPQKHTLKPEDAIQSAEAAAAMILVY